MYHCRFNTTDPDVRACDCQTWCLATNKRVAGGGADWFDEHGLSVRTVLLLGLITLVHGRDAVLRRGP